jgi:hypothetical protein
MASREKTPLVSIKGGNLPPPVRAPLVGEGEARIKIGPNHQIDAVEAGFFSALISRYSVTPVMTSASSNGPRKTPSTP